MTFQEAATQYQQLSAQHAAGKLSDADFETQINDLRLQDAEGRWWQIGVQSGDWYVNDGQRWVKSNPPTETGAGAVAKDQPAAEKTAKESPAKEESAGAARPSMPLRQLFSSKPTERGNGGLPMPAFIAIIVVVAIVGAGLIFGGYLLLSGQINLGGTARATVTPTRIAVAQPTLPLPTLAPAQPTNPPAVQPTVPITPALTATNTRPPAATRTPTRPAATAAPVFSPTPAPAPGIYVTNIVPDPNPASYGSDNPVGFRVTFFNNTGAFRVLFVRVKIFDPQGNFRNSIGESKEMQVEIRTGSNDVLIERSWTIARGAACDWVAEVYTRDSKGTTDFITPTKTNGQRGTFSFKMAC